MKVLSLFDGMACGAIALKMVGIEMETYDAFEIDQYSIKVATHNFPLIKQHGDVFKADFTKFAGVDLVCGGSPCTYWSIAQKNNRETEASGMGWELFSQFVRAVNEAKPRFFIYENNYSMSASIRESITKAFGFEPVCINSNLVSAQNRRRLYWVGKRNADGTYSKVHVSLPEDRKVYLKDVVDNVAANGNPIGVGYRNRRELDGKLYRRFETSGAEKANALTTVQTDSMVAQAVCYRGRYTKDGKYFVNYEFRTDEKANALVGNYTKALVIKTAIDGESVYKVFNGEIEIKGKQYKIKLPDGNYVIRNYTVDECKRLQTVPEWYDMSVISNTRAYKCLGNGWTVAVIAHILTELK